MSIQLLTADNDLSCYEAWVRAHPQGSLWQSLVRKKYAEACGKEGRVYVSSKNQESRTRPDDPVGRVKNQDDEIIASALVVIDRTAGGFSTWEIPRGPLWSDELPAMSYEPVQVLMDTIIRDAIEQRSICLYLSPPLPIQLKAQSSKLKASPRHIHCEATRVIDLTLSETEILAQMHPKGRYNISIAQRHGVTVSEGSVQDIDAFHDLLRDTGSRDGFKIHQKSHYTRFLDYIDGSFFLMAKHAGKPIAGLIGVMWPLPSPPTPLPVGEGWRATTSRGEGGTGIYYYGASSLEDRALMAPYLLQWEAMRKCKTLGCTKYDLLGVEPEERIADSGPRVAHPWAGISEFKRKFGGTVITYPPEQMIVLRPLAYKALELKRRLFG